MKVLFVGSAPAPTAGGAHGVLTTAIAALEKAQPDAHTFHFAHGPQDGYDFTWFLSPDGKFAQCVTPFAFTVWDLGHRVLPYFPEMSLSGWKFDSREARYRDALPRAAIVVASADNVRDQIGVFYHIPWDRIIVNPEPLDPRLHVMQGKTDILDKHSLTFSHYLLYPAQFWPHKNHITAIDTLKLLLDRGEDMRLVFTGADKGNQKYVFNYARNLLPPERVIFAGFVEMAELAALYRSAFATIVSTLLPACSLPVTEAMACGCPVVQTLLNPVSAAGQVLALKVNSIREQHVAENLERVKQYDGAHYVENIVAELDRFAKIRRLWGASYVHL